MLIYVEGNHIYYDLVNAIALKFITTNNDLNYFYSKCFNQFLDINNNGLLKTVIQ
jgi:hypothetical protein